LPTDAWPLAFSVIERPKDPFWATPRSVSLATSVRRFKSTFNRSRPDPAAPKVLQMETRCRRTHGQMASGRHARDAVPRAPGRGCAPHPWRNMSPGRLRALILPPPRPPHSTTCGASTQFRGESGPLCASGKPGEISPGLGWRWLGLACYKTAPMEPDPF
jgi:hypothetical protein